MGDALINLIAFTLGLSDRFFVTRSQHSVM